MSLLFLFFLFCLGICIGSFLGVIIDRLPRNESIVEGRSYCEFCKKKLTAFDLIPLLSFVALGGKCRYCHKKLSLYYPIVELTTGILFVVIGYITGLQILVLTYYLCLCVLLLVIFFIDLRFGIIPFSLVFIAVFMTFFYLWFSVGFLLNNVLAAVGAMVFFLMLFLITRGRGMGFGDVVYAFLMGFVLGFPKIIVGLYIAFVTGAIVSLLLIAFKKKKMQGGTVPFGPFLVLGTILSLFWGQYFINWAMVNLTK